MTDVLKCDYCYLPFQDLPEKEAMHMGCFHTFCRKCVGEIIGEEKKAKGVESLEVLSCPLCEGKTKLENDTVPEVREYVMDAVRRAAEEDAEEKMEDGEGEGDEAEGDEAE